MKTYCFVLILLSVAGCTSIEKSRPAEEVSRFMVDQVDSLYSYANTFVTAVESADALSVQRHFLRLRNTYKRVEALSEYYFPGVSRAINGPPLQKMEEGDDKIIMPSGFQVIEEMLFPQVTLDSTLLAEAKVLRSSFVRLKELAKTTTLTDENIFDAVRLQMLRMMSLGLSGFDSPVALHSIVEAKYSLSGVAEILSKYKGQIETQDRYLVDSLVWHLDRSITYLASNADFNSFDRAHFISHYCNSLTAAMQEYQYALNIRDQAHVQATLTRKTFFEERVFNPDFFSPSYNQQPSREKEELGRLLFFDPVLSGNQSRSCASCHKPTRAFSDNQDKSIAFNVKGRVRRNAPTLINAAFQQNQFWDGRVVFLEDQVTDVIINPDEMHGNLDDAASVLSKNTEYRNLFKRAFGKDSITSVELRSALAAYVRSLVAMNAPFDQYMRGNRTAMTSDQISGFNLFMGKGKCATCHFLPLFNGSVPPMYSETEAEVIGVPDAVTIAHAEADDDHGKAEFIRHSLFDRMFKTPTVRNASLTAPYMHNGAYKTLEDVIDFYNRGGGSGVGLALENQTLSSDSLGLSSKEKLQLITFINSLTDTTGITTQPRILPRLEGERSPRKIGGVY